MNIELTSKLGKLMDGYLRPFFTTVQSKFRNFIKEKVFGNIVREMIAEHIIMSQQQTPPKPSPEQLKKMFPPLKYGEKINMLKGYFSAQNYMFGQVCEKDFIDKLKTLSHKEIDELFNAIQEMNQSIAKKDFSFDKIKNESHEEAFRFQQELDERGFIELKQEEINDDKDK